MFLVIAAAVNLVAWRQARALVVYGAAGAPARPMLLRKPTDVGLGYDARRVPSERGVEIEVWVIQQVRTAAPWAILVPGWGAAKDRLLTAGGRFHRLGYSVALFDTRGAGGSDGDRTTWGWAEARDVVAVARWVRDEFGERAPLVYGFSAGGAAALRAAADGEVRPRALVIESTFDRFAGAVGRRAGLGAVPGGARLVAFWAGVVGGFPASAHAPIIYAASVTCPTLVLAGDADPSVAVDETRALAAALGGQREIVVLPGFGHEITTTLDDAQWMAIVGGFLERADVNRGTRPEPG